MSMTSESSSKIELHRFLVDGVLFELSEDLIQKRAPNSRLAREERRIEFYDIHKKAYVFDQSADVFEILVYFISTGLLSRPTNINNIKLYSLLSYFEMDEIVLNTFQKMEHLAFEINWEKTQYSTNSWIFKLFSLPFSPKSKLINTFFFLITIISYGNLCFEYTFGLASMIGFKFEIIYLIILIIEFLCRFIYVSNKFRYFRNYFTIIDILSILSCIFYLLKGNIFLQFISSFRFIRLLKLSRYSTYIRQYIQTIIYHYQISILLLSLFIILCLFFGNLIYGISLIDRHRIHSTPFQSFYYSYETILTIGFGVHIPSTP